MAGGQAQEGVGRASKEGRRDRVEALVGVEARGGRRPAAGELFVVCTRYFKHVLFAIGELRGEMIRRPSSQTPPKIRGSPRWYPYFKDCIGAIDGTHVTGRVPMSQSAAYRGKKHYTSQNVLAAFDFDLKFIYVLAGWEGHSSLRVAVERAFGALKNRFKILDQKPFRPYSTQIKLVLACCILHNWILQWGFDEHVPEEEEVEPDNIVSSGHGVEAFDNDAWKNKRLEWAEAMWLNRGQCMI
ncbi:uncharacterized protein [Aegilops tauschii subsp. strangulata]|uniref:uncharacterized protein n=1 Tax=Aegilops tauschii subsp. strangulata TaxID=200361 RepID=UPI001ABCD95B|nr:uncharacterized protein LOC120972811 [Aegilops tauschii subsp. strangulata]